LLNIMTSPFQPVFEALLRRTSVLCCSIAFRYAAAELLASNTPERAMAVLWKC